MEGFGWGSIRDTHIHVTQCYQHWLSRFGLKETDNRMQTEGINTIEDMRRLFKEVDQLVNSFLETFESKYDYKIKGQVSGEEEELTVLRLMTHTITHEFHHKGQIVSMARQLGYTPHDTDLLTPADIKKYF